MAQRSFVRIATVIIYQLCWVTTVYGGCSNGDEKVSEWRVAEFERKETDKALRNHVVSSVIVRSVLECSLRCLRHAQCESYNYEEEGQQHLCELNDRTALITPRDLLRRKGFSFYGYGTNPCLDVICQNGGTCHRTFTSLPASYCCYCDQHYQGDVCQHFKGFRFTNHSFPEQASIEVEGHANIDSLSVCLRFKSSEANLGVSTLISYVTNETEVVLQLYMDRAVRIVIKNHYSDFPFVSLLDETWHHVCFTWENNDGNLTLYTDGLLIGQKQGVHQQLTFDSAGMLVVGQFQKEFGESLALNKSYLGDITDINVWTSVLTPSVIQKESSECFGEVGDLLAWPSFSAPYLQSESEVDSIPTECKGFDPSATYDLEFQRRTNKDYVLLPKPTLPSLTAFTISLFVSFTDAGSKTYLNYFAQNALNEIFIYERSRQFFIRLKQVARSHNFVVEPDGLWHHVAVTWNSINGSYEIFVDGKTKAGGKGLVNGTTIKPAGTFVVGNDKDLKDYQSRDAFVGNISRINIWDYVLSRETIGLLSRRCGLEMGEILAWRDIKGGSFHGEIYILEPSSCERPV